MKIYSCIIGSLILVLGPWIGSTSSSPAHQQPKSRVIESLPAPIDQEIEKIRAADEWHNPFVLVNREGYELIRHPQPRNPTLLTLEQLERTLVNLPIESWPLGRVIAVAENGLRSPGDGKGIALNLKSLKKMLRSHKLRVDLWPAG